MAVSARLQAVLTGSLARVVETTLNLKISLDVRRELLGNAIAIKTKICQLIVMLRATLAH